MMSDPADASGRSLPESRLHHPGPLFQQPPPSSNDLHPLPTTSGLFQAQILQTLTRSDVVDVLFMDDDWSVEGVLGLVAAEPCQYHALIDTGALITGLTNFQVAQRLIELLPAATFDGVVYLGEQDSKQILPRATLRPMPLSESGIPRSRRFTFFDQVHTTGMDIPQPLVTTALLTLSPHMNFRDYAQGAYRMRGIGQGQTIRLLVIPQVGACRCIPCPHK